MNFLHKSLAVLAFSSALLVGAASAATFDFDFTGRNLSDRSSTSYTVDGLTLTVTAGTFRTSSNRSNINFGSRRVDIDRNGLGADRRHDGDSIDGSFGNDVLVFSFGSEVAIDTIGFSEVDSNDDFAFGAVTRRSFNRIVNFQDVLRSTDVSGFATDMQRTGLAFGIGAIGWNDNFRVTSLSVSSVPLPASGLMLLAAMGLGMGAARRRKAKAA